MSRRYQSVVFIVLSLFANYVLADTKLVPPIKSDQLKQSNAGAYLGMGIDLLPSELSAQLPEDIMIGQGILVSGFTQNSPAPKQGIKLYDILLNYNGIPIKHPRQFIKLIKKDKPDNKIKLTIARQGKLITLPMTMGSENYPLDKDQLDYQYNMQTLGYDGYVLKMTSKNYFDATIRFLAADGVVRRRSFKGYYNRIMPEIQAAPDMSRFAKQKLMSLITERKNDEDGWFGDWLPFSDGVFF